MEAEIYKGYAGAAEKLMPLLMECYHINTLDSVEQELAQEIQSRETHDEECRVSLNASGDVLEIRMVANEFVINPTPGDEIFAACTNKTLTISVHQGVLPDGSLDRLLINTILVRTVHEWDGMIKSYSMVSCSVIYTHYADLLQKLEDFQNFWGEELLERLGMDFCLQDGLFTPLEQEPEEKSDWESETFTAAELYLGPDEKEE